MSRPGDRKPDDWASNTSLNGFVSQVAEGLFPRFWLTATFLAMVFSRLGWISETLPGVGHLGIGILAFYHAIASLSFAFTGRALVPLGPPLLVADTVAVVRPVLRCVLD
jgi:hypothetical protein